MERILSGSKHRLASSTHESGFLQLNKQAPSVMDQRIDNYPKDRTYRLDLTRCVVQSCGGALTEVSYYERNNWVTIEYQCSKCGREFTVKIEG